MYDLDEKVIYKNRPCTVHSRVWTLKPFGILYSLKMDGSFPNLHQAHESEVTAYEAPAAEVLEFARP